MSLNDTVLVWLSKLFSERFGLELLLHRSGKDVLLRLPSTEGGIIFDCAQACFTKSASDFPVANWDAEKENFSSALGISIPAPGISDTPQPLVEQKCNNHVVHYDIPGLTYWMLARVEEIGRTDLDNHGRFPAISSHAFKHGYIDRPIVDEWLYVLGQVIERQWPGVALKEHKPSVLVSCDVDHPYLFNGSLRKLPRRIAQDVFRLRSYPSLVSTLRATLDGLNIDKPTDPYLKNLMWMMDVNEKAGNRVAFYFIAGGSHPKDGEYRMVEPIIRQLLRRIHQRGHEIGLHPSFLTFMNREQMCREADLLRETLQSEGIPFQNLGGRQHFLRWKTPHTARNWEAAGMNYDSTLSYADHPGFRCGTCFEYTMFDPIDQKMLRIRQRPLVLMECSVIEEKYLGYGFSDESINLMLNYKMRVFKLGGEFTLLWHNSFFNQQKAYDFYQELIQPF